MSRPIIKLVSVRKPRIKRWHIVSDHSDVRSKHTLYKAGKRPVVVLPGKVVQV